MAEYIEREAAMQVLCDACGNAACPKGLIPKCSYGERMQSIPAADVRPVVLCKDCRHRDPEDGKCDAGAVERAGCVFPVGDNYFCAYGEKRKES